MSLLKYQNKRDFKTTTEPEGKLVQSKGNPLFIVQKHAASHLHYDFRLEVDGVLKSWAIPKGPSMNPAEKRLAIMVEDHPYHYKDFEGLIPEGNYGAGKVIVWDSGTYGLIAASGEDSSKITLNSELQKGRVHIFLEGKKLKGEFTLVKFKSKKDDSWLLIKSLDEFATTSDILKEDRSVISNKTLEDLV